MATVWRWLVLGAAAALGGVLVAFGVPAPKVEPTKRALVGEWSFTSSLKQPNDTEVVWTLRENGTVRIDGFDRASGALARGPMVGRWRLEGRDLLCVWEVWNEAERRPAQVQERLRVRESGAGSLALQVIYPPPRDSEEGATLEFKRFGGWVQRP